MQINLASMPHTIFLAFFDFVLLVYWLCAFSLLFINNIFISDQTSSQWKHQKQNKIINIDEIRCVQINKATTSFHNNKSIHSNKFHYAITCVTTNGSLVQKLLHVYNMQHLWCVCFVCLQSNTSVKLDHSVADTCLLQSYISFHLRFVLPEI